MSCSFVCVLLLHTFEEKKKKGRKKIHLFVSCSFVCVLLLHMFEENMEHVFCRESVVKILGEKNGTHFLERKVVTKSTEHGKCE